MGGTRWSDEHYRQMAAARLESGRSAFGHDQDIRERRVVAGVHDLMNPRLFMPWGRESRDSDAHPASNAVAVLFDVTGSMQQVPRILQASLCRLFGLLVRRGYLADPAVLVGGVGDATCDVAPLQIGQFESGNEIEDDLGRLFLEGGGGGQKTESYELALYFLARRTSLDCLEKRGCKGYAFLVGDEMPYGKVKRREVEAVFGDRLTADIPIRDMVAEVQRKYELYFVVPNLTSHFDDTQVLGCWRSLLGQNLLRLADPAGIGELIASTIALSEQTVAWDAIADDLRDAGVDRRVAEAVSTALSDAPHCAQLAGTDLGAF